MDNRHKKGSASLVSRKMQIKPIMRHHLTAVRMAILKSQQITSDGEDVENSKPSCTVGGTAH